MPISTICIEAESGVVLNESNADLVRPPASMLKLMLMLVVAEGIERGDWSMTTPITASARAQYMGGTQVHLAEGEIFPLGKLLEAVAIASANDASMAIAEGLWGSETACLAAMNARAQELGMEATILRSVHGLPPDKGELPDETTARDMAKLGRACATIPLIMDLTGRREMQFREGDPVYYSTNKLLWRMPDCDGMKTGFIRAAGFCITATAKRDGVRLISVVMGHPTVYGRFNLAQQVMDEAFASVTRVAVVSAGEELSEPLPVRDGLRDGVRMAAARDIWLTIRREDWSRLQVDAYADDDLRTPIEKGARVGELVVSLDGRELDRTVLNATESMEPLGWRLTLRDGRAQWEGLDRKVAFN